MYTVKSAMEQLTDPKIILQNVSDTLRKIDPQFAKEEQQYHAAVAALEATIGNTVSPSAAEYIAAKEQEICAEISGMVRLSAKSEVFPESYQHYVLENGL